MSTIETPVSGDGNDGPATADTTADGAEPSAQARELLLGPVTRGFPPGSRPTSGASPRGDAPASDTVDASDTAVAAVGAPEGAAAQPAGPGVAEASPWQRSYAVWQRAGTGWHPIDPAARARATARPRGIRKGRAGRGALPSVRTALAGRASRTGHAAGPGRSPWGAAEGGPAAGLPPAPSHVNPAAAHAATEPADEAAADGSAFVPGAAENEREDAARDAWEGGDRREGDRPSWDTGSPAEPSAGTWDAGAGTDVWDGGGRADTREPAARTDTWDVDRADPYGPHGPHDVDERPAWSAPGTGAGAPPDDAVPHEPSAPADRARRAPFGPYDEADADDQPAPPDPDPPAGDGAPFDTSSGYDSPSEFDSPSGFDTPTGFDDPAFRGRPAGRRRIVVIAAVAALAALAAIAGGGAYALVGAGRSAEETTGATVGDWIFATDPSATTDGRVQELRGVAAVDNTIVAVGSETGGDYYRGQFLASSDGGRTWRLARVRTPDGGEPPPGEFPERVAGAPGRWSALGGSSVRRVVWTSTDGMTWIRQPDSAASAFRGGDQVNAITRADSGFIAVGTAGGRGRARHAAAWTSADGRDWTRLPATAFPTGGGGRALRLDRVAARGITVVASGTVGKPAAAGGGREALWRSSDGGRTWTRLTVPRPRGSAGPLGDVAAGPGGFYAVRDARVTGKLRKRLGPGRLALVLRSLDGLRWTPIGHIRTPGYVRAARLAGSSAALAALITVRDGRTLVFRSADGVVWRSGGEVEPRPGRTLTDAAVTPTAIAVTGRQGAGETTGAYLAAFGGAGPVDLGRVPDAVHPERRIIEVAAHSSRAVAVGSANGQAAVWTSSDGSTWSRGHALGDAFGGPGQQRLYDVIYGGKGWLAVGVSGNGRRRPLVVTSPDGQAWRAVGGRVFGRRGGGEQSTYGITYGPRGYVVVGERVVKGRSTAVAWRSTDAVRWSGPADTGRRGTSMRDVAASTAGYVAVGTRNEGTAPRPAVWISPDGRRWTAALREPPMPPGLTGGGLDRVIARGDTIVAAGWVLDPRGKDGVASYLAVSADGGRTWQRPALPDDGRPTGPVTAATATDGGFVVAVASGPVSRDRVALWSSVDGRSWRARYPEGRGLTGPGTHRLTGITPYQGTLLTVGFTGDHRRDVPLLWQTALP